MPVDNSRSLRRRREDWLRRSGLPMVLPPGVRARRLLQRSAPVMLIAAIELVALALALRVEKMLLGRNIDDLAFDNEAVVMAVGMLALIVIGPFLGLLLAWLMRRLNYAVRLAVGIAMLVGCLVVPLLIGEPGARLPLWLPISVAAVVLLLQGYLAIGSILGWLARRGMETVAAAGPMVTRALPVLVMATMFFFFNAEVWQVAANVTFWRAAIISLAMLALAVVMVLVAMRDEVGRIREEFEEDEPARAEQLLAATPFDAGYGAAPRLRRAERANLLAVPVLAQLIQIALFATLITIFFYLFGLLAVSDATAKIWITKAPEEFSGILAGLPGSWPLAKVSLVLGAFCGLSFAASSVSDAGHKARFVRPILSELEQALAARDSYVCAYHLGNRRARHDT